MLYEVLRRRIFKYPTASELWSRRLAVGRADALAGALTIQLDTHISSGLGLRYDMATALTVIHVYTFLGMSGGSGES